MSTKKLGFYKKNIIKCYSSSAHVPAQKHKLDTKTRASSAFCLTLNVGQFTPLCTQTLKQSAFSYLASGKEHHLPTKGRDLLLLLLDCPAIIYIKINRWHPFTHTGNVSDTLFQSKGSSSTRHQINIHENKI